MTTFIAYGNINDTYPLESIPRELLIEKLRQPQSSNQRVQKRHRCRWVAHFLLWQLLKISQKPTALLKLIDYSQSGRPQLPVHDVDFNISHSGDWVAVILRVNTQGDSIVGIDIESPQKERDYPALLAYFASPSEQAWFAQQQEKEKSFYLSWCLREAVLKSQGVGIVKLSAVQHDPLLCQIQSQHCPAGQLVFSHRLPFYLAFFINQTQCLDVHYFTWQRGILAETTLHDATYYKVNEKT
ncbi:4'-phosphopantetheinyl transferase family protein [Pasteurella multocida]|uniref:4'-phosphopantetheinyl transferase family protein n=1 Tax=Pasteurella multocida TaxID=747 RepID=UPI00201FBC08|nr:4'-phosphopantetheinyl transferase superfamily protein [Pasteurella multocida]MCL7817691.1 4'-phosphopantetheinyl transferase superfamily protein [Pasteurella multocida]MEB3456457.1 4'-phosphopantetheinyl transferase superfamily protein [Pasteurella multocida]MEB3488188.1 4'-phosphopantetheinyl transferase superfamily protein [Pasteurella multocida]MEB3489702.1 4'-phosphopantetheinyl transferase superfamily protein [Pasteurella multocida]WRK08499.1 4'-phosphopantetheinyl transferase superfa